MPDPQMLARLKVKNHVTEIVTRSVIHTVNTMFGQNIEAVRSNMPVKGDTVTVRVLLLQDDTCAVFRFAFDRALLVTLISSYYPPETLEGNFPFEDGASEIANIVCNRVKKFLNQQGYNLAMSLPEIEREGTGRLDPGAVNLNFTMDSTDQLHIDFDITENRIAV